MRKHKRRIKPNTKSIQEILIMAALMFCAMVALVYMVKYYSLVLDWNKLALDYDSCRAILHGLGFKFTP